VTRESRTASLAYLVWAVAILERATPQPEVSSWYRFHIRQALWFGVLSSAVGLAALFWPAILSLAIGNIVATLWIYGLAIIADIALFVLWLILAMRYSQQAARGELFDIPWVARLTGTSVQK
jgi:hypothetical protein